MRTDGQEMKKFPTVTAVLGIMTGIAVLSAILYSVVLVMATYGQNYGIVAIAVLVLLVALVIDIFENR